MLFFYGSDILLCHQKCYLAYLYLETLCKHKDVTSYTRNFRLCQSISFKSQQFYGFLCNTSCLYETFRTIVFNTGLASPYKVHDSQLFGEENRYSWA